MANLLQQAYPGHGKGKRNTKNYKMEGGEKKKK